LTIASRFVRVLSGQAVNLSRTRKLLEGDHLRGAVDAYAIAPYFGHALQHFGAADSPLDPARIEALMGVLDASVSETRDLIRANLALARAAGLQLIAYEAGQHITNPPGRADFCAALNRHPRMAELYSRYLALWERETGGTLMMIFADMSVYGQSGCWGLSEYHGQPADKAPKLHAVRQHVKRTGVAQ